MLCFIVQEFLQTLDYDKTSFRHVPQAEFARSGLCINANLVDLCARISATDMANKLDNREYGVWLTASGLPQAESQALSNKIEHFLCETWQLCSHKYFKRWAEFSTSDGESAGNGATRVYKKYVSIVKKYQDVLFRMLNHPSTSMTVHAVTFEKALFNYDRNEVFPYLGMIGMSRQVYYYASIIFSFINYDSLEIWTPMIRVFPYS